MMLDRSVWVLMILWKNIVILMPRAEKVSVTVQEGSENLKELDCEGKQLGKGKEMRKEAE